MNPIKAAAVDLPPVDNEGYLLNPEDWDLAIAAELARQLQIEMTAAHWQVVNFIRQWYERHQSVPEARRALQYLRQQNDSERASRKYLYSLFPYGYGQQACKIAGMRKPLKLMLDV